MEAVKLSKPFKVGDKELAELVFDFDKLTGDDVILCEREATIARGQQVNGALLLDAGFHAQIAARACGIDPAQLRKLPAVDFLAVVTATQGFLVGSV